jgi:hypothetical protein
MQADVSRSERLERYLSEGATTVEGWLDPFSARVIAALADRQAAVGGPGALGEIGVHHGKLFIVLAIAAGAQERLFAIDVFGRQELNVDRSGAGDLRRFQDNVRRWAGREDVETLVESSLAVSPERLLQRCGRVRLISIDGGHTAECAESDLRLAEAVSREDGVAVLDDYFSPSWPGVSTGAARYLLGGGALRPFAITPNKVYFARREACAAHRANLKQAFPFNWDRESAMFDDPVDIYRSRPQPIRNALRTSPAWPLVRPAARAAWRALGLKQKK